MAEKALSEGKATEGIAMMQKAMEAAQAAIAAAPSDPGRFWTCAGSGPGC